MCLHQILGKVQYHVMFFIPFRGYLLIFPLFPVRRRTDTNVLSSAHPRGILTLDKYSLFFQLWSWFYLLWIGLLKIFRNTNKKTMSYAFGFVKLPQMSPVFLSNFSLQNLIDFLHWGHFPHLFQLTNTVFPLSIYVNIQTLFVF